MVRRKTVHNITYILGENALENHSIIKKANPNYWWFHMDESPSGHCIVCNNNINNNIMIIAGNYIKKYSNYKNNNICYTQIKNIKITEKPGEVIFTKNPDIFNCYDTNIYHYNNIKTGVASEYIVPNGQINITSHAIGSGIYGLATPQNKNHNIFKLQNPLIFNSNEECDNYIEASNYLNRKIGDYKIIPIRIIADEFCKMMPQFDFTIVFKQLKQFIADYKNRKDIVMMPINYILLEYNYDGIYSKNTIMDSFNKGNIMFVKYKTKKYTPPINHFKRRNGCNTFTLKI